MVAEPTDAELLVQIAAGAASAWETLVQRHAGAVYPLALRMLRNPEDAEDAVQETFLRVRKSAGSFRFGQDARGWIAQIACREALKMVRQRTKSVRIRQRVSVEKGEEPSAVNRLRAAEDEVVRTLNAAVDELPEALRMTVVLHFGAGMNQAAVAEELGCTQSTISDRLRQALEALRRHLSAAGVTSATALAPASLSSALTTECHAGIARLVLKGCSEAAAESLRLVQVKSGSAVAAGWPLGVGAAVVLSAGLAWWAASGSPPATTSVAATPGQAIPVAAVPSALPAAQPLPPQQLLAPNNPPARRISGARLLFTFTEYTAVIKSVCFLEQGKKIAAGGFDGSVKLWNLAEGTYDGSLEGSSGGIYGMAASPDGLTLATATHQGTISLWDTQARKLRLAFQGHASPIHNLAFSSDGKLLASCGTDALVKMWDAATGREKAIFKSHTGTVNNLKFSPDDQWLASASKDRTVRVWDVEGGSAGRERLVFAEHRNEVFALAYSPDGKYLASGGGGSGCVSTEFPLKIWDASSGRELRSIAFHTSHKLVFSPDSKVLVVSGCKHMPVKVFDVDSGEELLALDCGQGLTEALDLSADGYRLATGSADRKVRIWDLLTGKTPSTKK